MRGLKKREEEAYEEAKLALEEYEEQLEDTTGTKNPKAGASSGRRFFGARNVQNQEASKKTKPDRSNSDSEEDQGDRENSSFETDENNDLQKDAHANTVLVNGDAETHQASFLEVLEILALLQ